MDCVKLVSRLHKMTSIPNRSHTSGRLEEGNKTEKPTSFESEQREKEPKKMTLSLAPSL